MSADPRNLDAQYATDENLRIRCETHERFTVGPALEPAIDSALNLRGNESLLDIGTGPGGFLHRLRKSGHPERLTGVDRSPGMIASGRALDNRIDWLCVDAQALSFADASFDVATARHMLYHVPDIPRALREARRVLRPGGLFLAVTNARGYLAEYCDAMLEAATSATSAGATVLREEVASPASKTFDDINGAEFLRDVFGNVNVAYLNAALRFTDVEPVLRYFDSGAHDAGLH